MAPSFAADAEPSAHEQDLPEAFAGAWNRADASGRSGVDTMEWHASHGVLALLFDVASWHPWLDRARALLDPSELERAARKHRRQDRDDLALAYALRRLVLGRLLHRDPVRIPLARTSLGRPLITDDEMQTSLSHADGAVAVAVSRAGVVGIDLESSLRAAQMPEIAEHVMHPAEADAMESLTGAQREAALLSLWVRKEALLKAAGIGLAREMDSFRAPADRRVALPAIEGPDGADVVIRMLDIGPDWMAAVAAAPDVAIRCAWLSPHAG